MKDICANRHGGNPESIQAHLDSLVRSKKHVGFILQCCADQAGATCREVANHLNVGMNVISGRFTELKEANLIVKTGVRSRCAIYHLVNSNP